MISVFLCVLAFAGCWILAHKSVAYGLIALTAVGYAYGILRANLLGGAVYFLFDCAVFGFFIGYRWRADNTEKRRLRAIHRWLAVLICLPFAIAMIPLQTPMVTLVGLRGNVFFLPFLYVGARLCRKDISVYAGGLALLNGLAFGMALLEYVKGVPAFYPRNAVTEIIYNSNDVANHQFLRIPATFINAHAFGGTMVATLPFLFGVWSHRSSGRPLQTLALVGIAVASAGTLMASVRIAFIQLAAVGIMAIVWGRFGWRSRSALIGVLVLIAGLAATNERFQRFKSLEASTVSTRVGGSVNRTFIEVLLQYPIGNGIGGGGTSMPAFLEGQLRRPVSIESEFARILLEQGIPGLLVWVAFVIWIFGRWWALQRGEWQYGKRLAFVAITISLLIAVIGVGLLTSIPQTVLFLLLVGWATAPARREDCAELSGRPKLFQGAVLPRYASVSLASSR